jgi:hypothetical protein
MNNKIFICLAARFTRTDEGNWWYSFELQYTLRAVAGHMLIVLTHPGTE